jgi:serine/threonine-protein kinase
MLPKFHGRLGDALVGLGVLKPAELYTAITSQVRARYLEAFRWRAGQWAWVPGARAGEESLPLREPAADLIREAARATDFAVVTASLEPLRERVLVRMPDPTLSAGVFGLPESWTRALAAVSGRATLTNLVLTQTGGGREDPEDVYRALWFGLQAGLLRAA